MTKRKQMCIAVLSVLALLIACVCGAFSVAADEPEGEQWQETEDGQFLYTPYSYRGQDGVKVVYIGDGDDVTVPATFGGQAADLVWFEDEPLDLQFDQSEQAQAWLAKARASARRYLNVAFEEGPTTVWVRPVDWPNFRLVHSVTLPKSATEAYLIVAGAAAISAPAKSALTKFDLYPALENVENPQPTTIDLTGATGLQRVWIGRDDYWSDCFMEGSVLKLPIELKDAPVYREHPSSETELPYVFIDGEHPTPLTIQYAEAVPTTWQETEDGQFLYRPYPYGEDNCVQVMYIGDGTDVTVPATFGGEAFDMIWFTDASAIDFGRSDSEQAQTWYSKAEAASDRYLNLTFEEGPTGVKVTPGMYPGSIQATSVTLPKSVTGVSLYVEGLTAVSVPEGSALTTFSLYNVPEGWEHPSLTVIDLTGATGLQRVWIGRDEWGGDCFAKGSVLKLPTVFKSVPILRKAPFRLTDEVYFCIDVAPMSLTIQYADGSETSLILLGDVNEDGSVDMKDVLCIRLYISGCIGHENVLQHIGASVRISADATGDGNIDMKDVLMIRQYIAGLIDHLGKAA